MVRYIVSAASDPTVASHASADRLCGRNRRFVYDVSITNGCSSSLMSHSVEPSVRGYVMSSFGKVKSSEKTLAFIGEKSYIYA
jgi:hypothetical protein